MLNANWSDKVKMGEFLLKNRICMAALTRQRCNPENGIPNDLLIEYYSQRIGASMILT
jgi:N-ethylmaleimide reductase